MKNLKKVIGVLLILTTMTGCVKYKNTMTINNDKSMIFEGSYLISDKLLETSDSTTFFSEENKKALEERGVKVSEKKENNYTGIAVSKKYDNIDILELTDLIQSDDDYNECINHFSRRVYADFAGKIVGMLNKKLGKNYLELKN